MDWRNYQFWRKNIRRLEKTEAEFNLLVQRTKQRIVVGKQIRKSFQLLQRSSKDSERVSKQQIIFRKFRNLGQSVSFFKKL